MLSIIVLGKESIKYANMDTYMAALIEKLQELWRGVITFDVSTEVGKQTFKLRGIFMWTIHDFPTYGLVARCVTKGYKGCPICGPNTIAQYSKRMRKMVYTSDRRQLNCTHPYRRNKCWFDGKLETKGTPQPIFPKQTFQNA
jgi:hypothetical protein